MLFADLISSNVHVKMCPTQLEGRNCDRLRRKSRTLRRTPQRLVQRRPRLAFKCPNCSKRYSSDQRLVSHHCKNPQPKKVEEASWKMIQTEAWYYDNLHISPQNTDDQGEFIVDTLYLTKENQLLCHSRGENCFITSDIKEMKIHRETLHSLLENRFGFETWVNAIPTRFWNSKSNKKEDVINNNFSNSFKKFLSKKQNTNEVWEVKPKKSKRNLQTESNDKINFKDLMQKMQSLNDTSVCKIEKK